MRSPLSEQHELPRGGLDHHWAGPNWRRGAATANIYLKPFGAKLLPDAVRTRRIAAAGEVAGMLVGG
jgi:hypothetical protein